MNLGRKKWNDNKEETKKEKYTGITEEMMVSGQIVE